MLTLPVRHRVVNEQEVVSLKVKAEEEDEEGEQPSPVLRVVLV